MDYSILASRPAPPWLRDDSYTDHPLGTLKSGKEAEVMLVERRYAGGAPILLAYKRYRPRRPRRGELRELGFQRATGYRHSSRYQAGWYFSSRDRRAVDTHSRHGQQLVEARWPVQELTNLERAWRAGAAVPYPVEGKDDGVVMEYIGDREAAAPRLLQARLEPGDAGSAWRQLHASLAALTAAGLVHGDLSAYNLLWWQGRLVLIDLPQAVEFVTNPDATELLHRDVANVAAWFDRNGVEVDVEATFVELLALAW